MAEFGMRAVRGRAAGDRLSAELEGEDPFDESNLHPLDQSKARDTHKRLLQWYYAERDKQSVNRLEMALDADFYDGIQWSDEDAEAVRARGQMPLVYNEIAPMIDWLIGTERRTRVDWRVLPRTDDDVDGADTKTKVLKYIGDINRVQFVRSQAFSDVAKAGIGWVDDGARDDPTQDILYSKYEDWRNVLWDSSGYELDLSDARYLFRWRWVDEDIALATFPDRADAIRQAVEDSTRFSQFNSDDDWYLGKPAGEYLAMQSVVSRGSSSAIDTQRRRVRLIECQYRDPVPTKIVADGPLRGAYVSDSDQVMQRHLAETGAPLVERIAMRVHIAIFTEGHLLSMGPSNYRHNRFSLTPFWAYRRSRDRLPYGPARRVRDIQQDLNKRASKALFMLNTNQILAEEGATDDWHNLRDEADRPDGTLVTKAGKRMELRRDTDAATGQIQMMTLAAQSIQKSAGVNNENLGRQTNAVSGAAIEARQQQGAVGTTEFFDNLRLAVQIQGEKQLSLAEQFYSQAKVVRLTQGKGQLEWVKINQPEEQPDGSIRYINDITATQADFVVSEADYAGTMRQVMFESLNQMATRLPPEVALRLMTIAMDYSDLPNSDEVADAIRNITGERDPNKEMTPEEAQQAEQQMAAQAEALQMQRESAVEALNEQRAKVRELNARAAQMEAQAAADGGGASQEIQQAIMQVQQQAADQIDALSEQLRKAQSEAANKTLAVRSDADTKLELGRIQADAQVRVAEIQRVSDDRLKAIEEKFTKVIDGLMKQVDEAKAEAKAAADKPVEAPKAEPAPAAAPAPAPAQPITLNVAIDAKPTASKVIDVQRDAAGNIVGAKVKDEGGKE